MKKIFFLIFGFLFFLNVGYSIDVSNCMQTNDPGTYYLTQDILNYSGALDDYACFNFEVPDPGVVIFDCQGHIIDGTHVGDSIGFRMTFSGLNTGRLELRNCVFSDWNFGIDVAKNQLGVVVEDVICFNNLDTGIDIDLNDDSALNMTNVLVYNNNGTGAMAGGMYLVDIAGGIFNNITSKNNKGTGIRLASSNNLNLSNIYVSNNLGLDASSGTGIITSNSSFFTNITSINNVYGITVPFDASFTYISNSLFINSSIYGLYIAPGAGIHTFFNNFFNNSVNYELDADGVFNVSKQLGSNIFELSNPYIAGNFWGNFSGGGFSEICNDSDNDGFCDNNYNLTGTNIDYLPISNKFIANTPPQIDFVYPDNEVISNIFDLDLDIMVSDLDNDTLSLNISYENYSCYFSHINYPYYNHYLCKWLNNLSYNSTYNWSVVINDEVDLTSETYFFTTPYEEPEINFYGFITELRSNYRYYASFNAKIHIYNYDDMSYYDTFSDSSGYFEINNISSGNYFIEVTKDNFISNKTTEYFVTGNYFRSYIIDSNELNYEIRYYVYDEEYTELTNYTFYLEDQEGRNFVELINSSFDLCLFNCSVDGSFLLIKNIPRNPYNLYNFKFMKSGFSEWNYYNFMDNYLDLIRNESYYIVMENISNINKYNISGYVYSSTGNPLSNIRIELYNNDENVGNVTYTNSSGYYLFENMIEAYREVWFLGNSRGYINYYYPEFFHDEEKEINVTLTPLTANMAILKGYVTDCKVGIGIENVKIQLFNDSFRNNSLLILYSDFSGYFNAELLKQTYYVTLSHNWFNSINTIFNINLNTNNFEECMNMKGDFYSIQFNLLKNNTPRKGFIQLKNPVFYQESFIPFLSNRMETDVNGHLSVGLQGGEYDVYAGVFPKGLKYIKTIIINKDEVINIDIQEDFSGELLDLFGIPSNEESFWNWITNYGWFLFFIIFILFILVIVKNQINELK